jgi:DNA-binding CsgD family transcriptional regulator
MSLTAKERRILDLANQGLSDYKIARQLNLDPAVVTRSHKRAHKKLAKAQIDVEWATNIGLDISEFDSNT